MVAIKMEFMRLQKFLSQAGVASRREAERLIGSGRIRLNGKIVTEMGIQVHPERDQVYFDNKLIRPKSVEFYLMLNKPINYLVTRTDTHNRPTIYDLLPDCYQSLHSIGRLDYNSSGLLLLTTDGELTQRLLHPRYHVEKIYLVEVIGKVDHVQIQALCNGILLEEGDTTQPAVVSIVKSQQNGAVLKFKLREGKKRQIRRMCKSMDWHVLKLIRLQIGNLKLGNLEEGQFRKLDDTEVNSLKLSAGLVKNDDFKNKFR